MNVHSGEDLMADLASVPLGGCVDVGGRGENVYARRVPSGWVYEYWDEANTRVTAAVFVPEEKP
jgi:hypothetical protein